MTLINMALVNDALKNWYLSGLRYQMNQKASPFYAQIERNSESVKGGEIIMAMRYGKNGGVGSRADDGNTPTPSGRKTKQAKWQTKNIFATIQLTDKVIKASKSNAGAFASLLELELEDAMTDAKDYFAKMLFGDGTGALCTVSAETTKNTFTVSDIRFLYEGMRVDVLTSDGGTAKATDRVITSVDRVTKAVTVDGAAFSTLVTDIMVTAGSYGLEITGLKKIFTPNTSLYGIDRSTNKWLNPNIITSVGEMAETDIQQAIDEVEIRTGNKVNFLMGSHGVRRAYQYLLQLSKRTTDVMQLKGGWNALSYNGIPLIADKYAPDGSMHCLNTDDFKLYEIEDWDWLSEDGAILKHVAGKAAYQAVLTKYADLGCQRPAGQTLMTGITEH